MFVTADLLKEIKDVIGKSDDAIAFRRISDAVRLLNNKYKGNDWNVGTMDICVYDGCVTLPADVANVLAVTSGGLPTIIRDQWFQFHVNGPGVSDWTPWGYTDDFGPVSTYRDPSGPVKLVASPDDSIDSNCKLRVYGWDKDGNRIYTPSADGILEDGFIVPTIYGYAAVNPASPSIARIERIQKDLTNGPVKLMAVDEATLESHTTIGYYMPWETVPSYRRIRVPDRTWIRIKYRRKDVEVRGIGDWINIENRQALYAMLKSIHFGMNDQMDRAAAFANMASALLSEEADSTRPPSNDTPQIIYDDYPYGGDSMFY